MYFIIAIWGGPRRGYASIKFMIYTLIGSVLMLLGILMLYWQHYSQFPNLLLRGRRPDAAVPCPGVCSGGSFWAFFLGFAVKVADVAFPHLGCRIAHVEGPYPPGRSYWPASC